MESPSRFTFSPDGNTNVFPIPVTMKGDNYIRIEIDDVVVNDRDKFDLVNNAVVFVNTADVPAGSKLSVLVVQTDEGIANLGTVSSVDVVSQNITNVNTVSNNIADVNTAVANLTAIKHAPAYAANAQAAEVNAAAQAAAAVQASADADSAKNAAASSASSAASSASAASNSSFTADSTLKLFETKYLGAKNSPPGLDNEGNALITGATYWDIPNGSMFIWDGSNWSPATGAADVVKTSITATASQTNFTIPLAADGNELVYLNGVLLIPNVDYTRPSSTVVQLTQGAAAGDNFFCVVNTLVDAGGFVNRSGDIMTGTLTVPKIGIGTSSPTVLIHGQKSDARMWLESPSGSHIEVGAGSVSAFVYNRSNAPLMFGTNNQERCRIDASGNLLVGKTSSNNTTDGHRFLPDGFVSHVRDGDLPMALYRKTSDGEIMRFYRDSTTVGAIGADSGRITLISDGRTWVLGSTNYFVATDNAVDLGSPTYRFKDIYATNGTIQTSDRNEKQDIDVLSDAEQRVAVACKGLLRKFRWKDAVAEKGDAARIHFGIIAQDLRDAFAAEGLDAGRYAMFISSTWWEAEETYTDDDGVEQTRTQHYDKQADAPAGAVEKTRLGVRYPELLAFIIGAL